MYVCNPCIFHLQENEERYRAIAENSPDAIIVRVEDNIVFANPAAVKLLRADSEADLFGLSVLSLYHPGDHSQVLGNRVKLDQSPDQQCVRRADHDRLSRLSRRNLCGVQVRH